MCSSSCLRFDFGQSFNEWLEKAVILTKDEAEILKPSPSPSNPAPPPSSAVPPSLFSKTREEESPNLRAETPATETAVAASTTPKTDKESKPEEESKPQAVGREEIAKANPVVKSCQDHQDLGTVDDGAATQT
ncbi:hypothetical protein OPV22_031076 [Ensete ventricosum]|uniref:Uncharacterized protein n=1 Tax=Ensete ventricosum TaxID=4639 RepID=A0AAV8PLH7_ENSVE|nr:hypothetical protein OPV22_031076 [Ensete ventricosum]